MKIKCLFLFLLFPFLFISCSDDDDPKESNGVVELTYTIDKEELALVQFKTVGAIHIDWGDGTTDKYSQKEVTARHDYSGKLGTYRVKVISLDGSLEEVNTMVYANESTGETSPIALSEIKLANVSTLKRLLIGNASALKAVDLSGSFSQLHTVIADNCPNLTRLDVTGCPNLNFVFCENNGLETLDLNKNAKVGELRLNGGKLTTLDLSKNPALNKLSCSNNSLTMLDVSKNPELEYLVCTENQLEDLAVKELKSIARLNIASNKLSTEVLNRIFTDLPTAEGVSRTILYSENPGSSNADENILKNKHWTISL